MSHSVKIYDTCIGCTQCVRACPCDVLEMVSSQDVVTIEKEWIKPTVEIKEKNGVLKGKFIQQLSIEV